jgi:hypothetical protein
MLFVCGVGVERWREGNTPERKKEKKKKKRKKINERERERQRDSELHTLRHLKGSY